SRSSAVPTAMPSRRSSSAKSSTRASKPAGPFSGSEPYSPDRRLAGLSLRDDATGQLDADALSDHVEVGSVLDDDVHRPLEYGLIDVVSAQEDQRARPVDRLRDRRRLLQIELAD